MYGHPFRPQTFNPVHGCVSTGTSRNVRVCEWLIRIPRIFTPLFARFCLARRPVVTPPGRGRRGGVRRPGGGRSLCRLRHTHLPSWWGLSTGMIRARTADTSTPEGSVKEPAGSAARPPQDGRYGQLPLADAAGILLSFGAGTVPVGATIRGMLLHPSLHGGRIRGPRRRRTGVHRRPGT